MVSAPIEGAFWIPITSAESYLNLTAHPTIAGGQSSEELSVQVKNEAGEEQAGAIFQAGSPFGNSRYFWRSAAPLAAGTYRVEMQATPPDGLPGALSLSLEVAASSADPSPSATLAASPLSEVQLDDVVTCCGTEEVCESRACSVECWTERYRYVPRIGGTYQGVAADRYERFTVFGAELTQPNNPGGDLSLFLSYADQLEESAELSLIPYEFEGDQLCATIKWQNLVTGEQGSSERQCFGAEEFEEIEHVTPSNEDLNEAASVCFEPPEGYPLATETPERAESIDEGGCAQATTLPTLWLAMLILGAMSAALRAALRDRRQNHPR